MNYIIGIIATITTPLTFYAGMSILNNKPDESLMYLRYQNRIKTSETIDKFADWRGSNNKGIYNVLFYLPSDNDSDKLVGRVQVCYYTGAVGHPYVYNKEETPNLDIFMMKRIADTLRNKGHKLMFETLVADPYLWEVKLGGTIVDPSPYCTTNHAELILNKDVVDFSTRAYLYGDKETLIKLYGNKTIVDKLIKKYPEMLQIIGNNKL
jgi:hypothetical protein